MLDREVTRPVDGPLLPAGSGTADLPGGTYARDAAVINQSADEHGLQAPYASLLRNLATNLSEAHAGRR